MILDNLLHHGQPQTGAVLLAMANKGLEELASNGLRDPTSVVADANFDPISNFTQFDLDTPRVCRDGLACVQQQVVKSTLQFLRIEPSGAVALLANGDADMVKFGMCPYRLNHMLDRVLDASVRRP